MTLLETLEQVGDVRTQEALARHTTLGIGGPADFYLAAPDTEAMRRSLPTISPQSSAQIWAWSRSCQSLESTTLVSPYSEPNRSSSPNAPARRSRENGNGARGAVDPHPRAVRDA